MHAGSESMPPCIACKQAATLYMLSFPLQSVVQESSDTNVRITEEADTIIHFYICMPHTDCTAASIG